jgi:hypothetical protein
MSFLGTRARRAVRVPRHPFAQEHGPTTLKVMHCADLAAAKAAVITLVGGSARYEYGCEKFAGRAPRTLPRAV